LAVLFGAGFVAVGLGSFAGHAAGTEWARLLDSLAIKAMLVPFVVLGMIRLGRLTERAAVAVAAGTIGLLWLIEMAAPDAGRPLLVVVAGAAALSTIMSGERTMLAIGAGLLGVGAVLWWLGRSDGPLCIADSAIQMHGLWHIFAAGGLLAIFRGLHDH
jgi:dihydroceramidase